MAEQTNTEFVGIVLSGGKSSRMGQDKGSLSLNGESLVERAVRVLNRAGAKPSVRK